MSLLLATLLQFQVQHYIELSLVVLGMLFLRILKMYGLVILLPLGCGLLTLDLIAQNILVTLNLFISGPDCFEIMLIIFAFISYQKLRTHRLEVLLHIMIMDIVFKIIGSNLYHSMTNYLLANLNVLFFAPLLYYLFYRMLDLHGRQRAVFLVSTIFSFFVFLLDFIFDSQVGPNQATGFILFFEALALSLLRLGKLVLDDTSTKRLVDMPQFWMSAEIFFVAIALIAYSAAEPLFYRLQEAPFTETIAFQVLGYMWMTGVLIIIVHCTKHQKSFQTSAGKLVKIAHSL